jgi:hypothetical protein
LKSTNQKHETQQESAEVTGAIDRFFQNFHLATILNQIGIRKTKGISALTIMSSIFSLAFIGKDFFRGIVQNQSVPFGKDAAYELLKGSCHNWRKVLMISVKLLARVFDHAEKKFIRGFRLLSVCWSDGVSLLPLDFAFYHRRIKRIGFKVSPRTLTREVAVTKGDSKQWRRRQIWLTPWSDGFQNVGVGGKKDWLVLISTNPELPNKEIVRLYGRRWDIEVFFKMAKQHLKLVKEIQARDFDSLVAHTSIVFMRYQFLAYDQRIRTNNRTFGQLFYCVYEEMADIAFLESLQRILTMAIDKLRKVSHIYRLMNL